MTKYTTIVAQLVTGAWVLMSCHMASQTNGEFGIHALMHAYVIREDVERVATVRGLVSEYHDEHFGFGEEWPADDVRRQELRQAFARNARND